MGVIIVGVVSLFSVGLSISVSFLGLKAFLNLLKGRV